MSINDILESKEKSERLMRNLSEKYMTEPDESIKKQYDNIKKANQIIYGLMEIWQLGTEINPILFEAINIIKHDGTINFKQEEV